MSKTSKPTVVTYSFATENKEMARVAELIIGGNTDIDKSELKKIQGYVKKFNEAKKDNGYICFDYNYKHQPLNRGKTITEPHSFRYLSLKTRTTIAKNEFDCIKIDNEDIDLLLQYCKINKIKCNKIQEYVDNSSKIIKTIMKEHETDRYDSIEMIENVIFRGDYQDDNVDFLIELKKEMKNISRKISLNELDIYNYVKSLNGAKPEFKVIRILVDDIKSKLLRKISVDLRTQKYMPVCFCDDSFYVSSGIGKGNKRINNKMLKTLEQEIKDKTEYEISLCLYDDDDIYKESNISKYVQNDCEAAEQLLKLVGHDKFKNCNGVLYVFNQKTGMFDSCKNTQTPWQVYAIEKKDFLIKKDPNFKGDYDKLKSYGTDESLLRKLKPFIYNNTIDDDFLDNKANSSLGYLLFKNGIYDFKKNKFTKEFDHNILFHNHVPHNFPERNEDNIKYARNLSFDKYGINKKAANCLLQAFAISLSGIDRLKKVYFCPGLTNTGKSKLCYMLSMCFGNYVKTFNAESFRKLPKSSDKDEAARNRWIYLAQHARVLVSNEITMGCKLDGSALKKVSSGGDKMIGRTHGGEEQEFSIQFNCFMMLNDMPPIEPLDEALYKRINIFEFKNQFIEANEEKDDTAIELDGIKFQMDKELDTKIKSKKFISGFIWMVLDAYQDYLNGKIYHFDEELKDEWISGDSSINKIRNVLSEHIVFTKDQNDTVSVKQITEIRNNNKKELRGISPKMFSDAITKLGGVQARTKTQRIWTGIKLIE